MGKYAGVNQYVIWGAKNYGRIAYETLHHEIPIACFCDNDSQKWGSNVVVDGETVRVVNPDEIKIGTTVIIATGQMYWNIIENQIADKWGGG